MSEAYEVGVDMDVRLRTSVRMLAAHDEAMDLVEERMSQSAITVLHHSPGT
jgi:hypothetical protein